MRRIPVARSFRLPEQQRHSVRGGWSLLQLVMIMATVTIITTVAVRLISMLLRVERRTFSQTTELANFGKLSRQFRADVHGALDCQPLSDSETDRVRLTLPNGRVILYGTQVQGVTRNVKDSDKLVRQELYRLAGVALRCERPEGLAPLVTLIVRQVSPDDTPKRSQGTDSSNTSNPGTVRSSGGKELRIEARLGRDMLQTQSAEKAAPAP